MKRLHRDDLFAWSEFQDDLDLDFNSLVWARKQGNVVVDPLELGAHDAEHLKALGGVHATIVTSSRHLREAQALRAKLGGELWGPAGERASFPVPCDRWLAEGDTPLPGLRVLALNGSKTPGELALVIESTTLVCGDLVRAHRAGSLMMLADEKLSDRAVAVRQIVRLAALPGVEAVLVGDGFSVYRDGQKLLAELRDRLTR